MTKKVYIKSFGCQMNVRDSEVIRGLLISKNYKLTDDSEAADILIFNTCSVRQHAEDKVWSEVGRISKRNRRPLTRDKKRQVIGIIGCMAQNYKESIFDRAPEVDFVVGPSDLDKIPAIIDKIIESPDPGVKGAGLFERKIWETEGTIRPEDIYHTGFYEDKDHAYVVISEGCSNFCSYCVVPYVRGPLRNRSHTDILKEIEEGIAKGITKFTLLGQNVNAYQCEGVNFVKLVESVNSVKGLKEFSFITSHPRDTSPQLFKVMADSGKLKKYLHLPVQSGSDRILKLMNRGYTRKYYLDLVDSYRKIVKGALLSSDIMVGFPSETEQDFKEVYDLVKEVKFDSAYIFKYSPRPHAESAAWADDVSNSEKQRRHKLILELQKAISRKKKDK